MWRVPPPPCFCTKSLQDVENKGWGCEKELQERTRVRNGLIMKGIGGRGRQVDVVVLGKAVWGHTRGGNADVFQYKGLAGKATRKTMKTKGRQNGNFEIGLLAVGFRAKEDLGTVWVRGGKRIGWKAGGERLIKRSATFTADPRPFRSER